MNQNQNQENLGRFINSQSYAMAKIRYGITSTKKGIQKTKDGREKTIFVCLNAKGQEVVRGLVSAALESAEKIPADAYLSEVEYERKSDGQTTTCFMLHKSANKVELAEFEEE